MKKVESLKLNKFKAYELKKESHNMVLGGTTTPTTSSGGCADTADNSSMTKDGGGAGVNTWPKKDITLGYVTLPAEPIITPRN